MQNALAGSTPSSSSSGVAAEPDHVAGPEDPPIRRVRKAHAGTLPTAIVIGGARVLLTPSETVSRTVYCPGWPHTCAGIRRRSRSCRRRRPTGT